MIGILRALFGRRDRQPTPEEEAMAARVRELV